MGFIIIFIIFFRLFSRFILIPPESFYSFIKTAERIAILLYASLPACYNYTSIVNQTIFSFQNSALFYFNALYNSGQLQSRTVRCIVNYTIFTPCTPLKQCCSNAFNHWHSSCTLFSKSISFQRKPVASPTRKSVPNISAKMCCDSFL